MIRTASSGSLVSPVSWTWIVVMGPHNNNNNTYDIRLAYKAMFFLTRYKVSRFVRIAPGPCSVFVPRLC